MKIIDKHGKLFGKVHIFDILICIVFIVVIFGAFNKLSGDALIDFGTGDKVEIEFWAETIPYAVEALECVKPGDKLAEDKKYLDGEIVEVKIVDANVSYPDNNGVVITGPHPYQKKAVIKAKAVVDKKNLIYELGKQEIREGQVIFLTTEKVSLSVIVTDYQEVSK